MKLFAIFAAVSVLADLPRDDSEFDYYSLVLTWPYGHCRQHPCKDGFQDNKFLIHGLWPTRIDGKHPRHCSKSTLLISDETKARLDPLMRSDHYSNEEFWQHEWLKHGSCIFDNPEDYFQKTLELYEQFTPEKIMKKFGFKPAEKQFIHYNTIQSYFKRNIEPRCYKENKDYYLTELVICFDEDFKQMNCPKKHVRQKNKQKCGDKFYLNDKYSNRRNDL